MHALQVTTYMFTFRLGERWECSIFIEVYVIVLRKIGHVAQIIIFQNSHLKAETNYFTYNNIYIFLLEMNLPPLGYHQLSLKSQKPFLVANRSARFKLNCLLPLRN